MSGDFSYNERPAECGNTSHSGWEVVQAKGWPPQDWPVFAVCRDEDTASVLCSALNNQQVPGQTEIPL